MPQLTVNSLKAYAYQRADVEKGYTNHHLDVDLSTLSVTINPIEEKIKRTFIGGKGFDLWLLWQAVDGDTRWDDPQNAVCIAAGPMGGTPSYPRGRAKASLPPFRP